MEKMRSLRRGIEQKMATSTWDRPPRKFLPEDKQKELLTLPAIRGCLPHASPDLVNFAFEKAKRVFAILLRSKCHDGPLDKALRHCMEYQFTDEELPIPEYVENQTCSHDPTGEEAVRKCAHMPYLNIFHEEEWEDTAWRGFYEGQWHFLAPVFDAEQFEYDFPSKTILPIVECIEGAGAGYFGIVRAGVIHPAHLQGFSEQKLYRVAIKEFVARGGREPKPEVAWRKEKNNLAQMPSHNHLNDRVAAVTVGDQYLLISTWADGGDLEKFWQDNVTVNLDGALIWNMLVQFQGLADALRSVHGRTKTNFSDVPNGIMETSTPSDASIPMITTTNTVDDSNWRHGDLKPANIFISLDPNTSPWPGVLKIGDLGLAKRHPVATARRSTPSSTEFGTHAYEPPEAMTGRLAPRSRLYDIWSFGCVLMETIIWLLYGYEGLQDLWATPIVRWKETLYYTILDNTVELSAEVNKSIRQVIKDILEHDPECTSTRGSVIRDLILLVRDKLLVVGLSDRQTPMASPGERIDARTLLQELTNIADKAKAPGGNLYLCTGRDRRGVTYRSIVKPKETSKQYLSAPSALSLAGNANSKQTQLPDSAKDIRMTGEDIDLSRLQLQNHRRLEEYTHEPLDPNDWTFTWDNGFAAVAARKMMLLSGVSHRKPKSAICANCCYMVEHPLARHKVSVTSLEGSSPQCELCQILLHNLSHKLPGDWKDSSQGDLLLRRVGSRIVFEQDGKRTPALSIGKIAGIQLAESQNNVQHSLPWLAEPGSDAYFALLRLWLRDCDNDHGDCWPPLNQSHYRLPTRLVKVGTKSTPFIRLTEATELPEQFKHSPKFAALSYPWGGRAQDKHFFTTKANYEQLKREILIQELPPLLQHAIKVAWNIGIEYIWVDALCIIQGPDGDFHEEAERMEQVFSAAYCVLAASRAKGVADGFLEDRKQRKAVSIPDSSVFLCEDIDDFQHDVVEGHLNQRGWVLQERALARRTIYFTETQTYWECGNGIRCETFTKMNNKQAAFLGDSNFPRMAEEDTKGGRISLFKSLYEQYSRLDFTNHHDKPIAIAGLERRLCSAFDTDGGFGLFDRYLERSLLWQRATTDVESLTKITFRPGQEYVPSWSWMSCRGGIKFLDLPYNGVDWTRDQYRSPWAMSPAATISRTTRSIRDRKTSTLGVIAREFTLDSKSHSGIVWDGGNAVEGSLKCAVIGKLRAEAGLSTQRHYVLILRQVDGVDVFERAGVGYLAKDKIDFRGTKSWSVMR